MILRKSICKSAALLMAISTSALLAESTNRSSYAGAVFVMTNNNDANQILRFGRQANGALVPLGSTATGGRGSGGNVDPLGSQNSLLLTQDAGFLLAVNSASGTLSSFEVQGANLKLVEVKASGGSAPNAIAQWGDLVYVLNTAGNSNVVGFHLEDGRLIRIPNGTSYLSSSISGGSSLAFTPDGKFLLAAERATNKIDAFPVNTDGTLGKAVVNNYPGIFDLAITSGGIVLSAGGPTIGASIVNANGAITVLSDPTLLGGGACWVVTTPNGAFAYASNPGGSLIDGYSVSGSGVLTAIGNGNVGTTASTAKPLDLAVSFDGEYLYSNNGGDGSVGIWTIKADGTLTAQTPVVLPTADASAGLNGIAAY